jgi:AraC-like DNA-binding protein
MHLLFNTESVELLATIMVNSGIIPLLVGPFLYLYIRSVLNDDPSLKKYDLLHILPFLAFLIFASPYLLSSWSIKTKAAEAFMQNFQSQGAFNTAFLGNKFLAYIVFILPAFQVLVYVIWSSLLLFRFLKQNKKKEVFFRLQSTMKWIKAFLGIEILLVSGHLLFMVKIFVMGDIRGFNSLNNLQFILGLGPMAILILTFFSPGILYGLPRIPEYRAELQIPEKTTGNGSSTGKTNQIKLESGYLQAIGNEADACMEKFQPYTNPGFNLTELSVLIHIPEHHISYYFREVKKQTFTDYRNEWRVKHAKNLIKEGKAVEMTMEAIGLLSGFTTRNTFFTAFKKAEGISPGAFASQFTA